MKNYQIGIMGSASDLKYTKKAEKVAKEIGKEIAKLNATLVFGAEKDCASLSTIAAKEAVKYNGVVVGITYGKSKDIFDKDSATIIIPCGLERGGGREFVLGLSCDGIIALSGGSGTLNEIAVAYQSNIPIVTLNNLGGWSEKLSNTFLDDRQRLKCIPASSAKEAVKKIVEQIKKWKNEKLKILTNE